MVNLMERDGRDLVEVKRDDGKRYFGFTAEATFPFLRLSFRTQRAYNKAKWQLPIQTPMVFENTKIILNDAFIDPMLKFFHATQDGFPMGWFSIDKRLVDQSFMASNQDRKTNCKYELSIPFRELRAEPECTKVIPLIKNAYDIEVDSALGAFPEAVKTYRSLTSSLVGIFERDKTLSKQTNDASGVRARFAGSARIRKCVRAAFAGITAARLAGVEPVFPKEPVSTQHIDACIEQVLNAQTKIDNLAPNRTIDELFNAVHYFAAEKQKREDMQNGVSLFEDDDDDGGERPFEKHAPTANLVRGQTVLDILLSDSHKHDVKVETIDRIITSIFPALKGDPVRAIGNAWCTAGSSDYHRVLFMLESCNPIPDAEVRTFATEEELLLGWRNWIVNELDPDYEWGWNNTTFDDAYMFHRARQLGIEQEFLQLSRVTGVISATTLGQNYRAYKERLELLKNNPHLVIDKEEIVIHSTQCKEFSLSYIQSIGRQKADAMIYYIRSGKRMTSFKLDDVASTIITDEITGATETEEGFGLGPDETLLKTKNIKGLNAGDYINLIKTGFSTEPAISKGFKAEIVRICDKGLIVRGRIADQLSLLIADPTLTVSWGLAKNDLDMKTMFRLAKESAEGRATVGKYCLRDCTLVLDIVNKQDIMGENIATAKVCCVTSDILLYGGQTVVFTSLLSKMCQAENIHIQDLPRITHPKDHKRQKFEGATVLDPIADVYTDNPVAVNDFAALYPTIAAGNNLSPDMKVWTKVINDDGIVIQMEGSEEFDNLPGWIYRNIEFDHFKQRKVVKKGKTSYVDERVGVKVCRWATRDDCGKSKGILPRVIMHLLEGRAQARRLMKAATDAFDKARYDQLQLAFKVRTNSVYGCQGADTSPVRDKDLAACITAIGRACLTFVKSVAEQCYANKIVTLKNGRQVLTNVLVVYGDTDSVFFTFNLADPLTGAPIRGREALIITFELAIEVARLASMFLPLPMELAFEKVLMAFVLLSKKRYFGLKHSNPFDPDFFEILMSGLATKRRDSCDFVKDLLGILLMTIRSGQSDAIEKCIEIIEEHLQLLADRKVSHEKLLLTCALRSYYKNPRSIKQWVLAERIGQRDPGAKPRPGDRVPFLFVIPPGGIKDKMVQGDRIETPEFIEAKNLKVDTEYYITNQLMNPVLQLLGLMVRRICRLKNKMGTLEKLEAELRRIDKSYADPAKRFKQRETACADVVQQLVFDPFLQKIKNKREGNQDIRRSFFAAPRAK